jgi:hypothetical protein
MTDLFGGMGAHLGEFVGAAHMVEVAVGQHEQRIASEQFRPGCSKGADAQTAIDEEVSVTAAHMPDIGLHQRINVGLGQDGGGGVDWSGDVPAVRDRQTHAVTPTVVTGMVQATLSVAPVVTRRRQRSSGRRSA